MEKKGFPVVKAQGSHYNIGFQVDAQCKDIVVDSIENFKKRFKDKVWQKVLLEANKCLPYAEDCPELVEEVRGCADGAQVKFDEYFALYCSDTIQSSTFSPIQACTDFAVSGDLTADGSVLVAHNNDTVGEQENFTFMLDAKPNDKPRFSAIVHGGVFPTSGFNSAGISITGNHLTPTDMRVGVPLGFTVRKVLSADRIGKAMEYAPSFTKGVQL